MGKNKKINAVDKKKIENLGNSLMKYPHIDNMGVPIMCKIIVHGSTLVTNGVFKSKIGDIDPAKKYVVESENLQDPTKILIKAFKKGGVVELDKALATYIKGYDLYKEYKKGQKESEARKAESTKVAIKQNKEILKSNLG